MVGLSEKILLFMNMIIDPRLRKDIKALKYAAEGYTYFAWKLLEKCDIDKMLKKRPCTVKEISEKVGIKNIKLLECILDLLVGEGCLYYKDDKYIFRKEPNDFPKTKHFRYLLNHYPNSVKWTETLFEMAEDALRYKKSSKKASFDDEAFLLLWEGIMEESPYSLRKLALKKLKKHVKDNSHILDLGCGSGVSLEQILLEFKNKKIFLTGVDSSKISLERAKKRLDRLYQSADSEILRKNIKNVKLIQHDLRKPLKIKEKFDVIFMSLLVHHIPKNKRKEFFERLKYLLKDDGKVCVFQIIHKSKFERAPMWVMHVVPTHKEYPYKEEWLDMLSSVFSRIKYWLDGMIVLAYK